MLHGRAQVLLIMVPTMLLTLLSLSLGRRLGMEAGGGGAVAVLAQAFAVTFGLRASERVASPNERN